MIKNEIEKILLNLLKTNDGILCFCKNYQNTLSIINSLYNERKFFFDFGPLSSIKKNQKIDSNHLAILISIHIHSFLLIDSLFENQNHLNDLFDISDSKMGKEAIISSLSINNSFDEILRMKDSHSMLKLFVSLLSDEKSISLFFNSNLSIDHVYNNVSTDFSRLRDDVSSTSNPINVLKSKGVRLNHFSLKYSFFSKV